jgi:hypothetical protein
MKKLLRWALRPIGWLVYWAVFGLRFTVRLVLALILMNTKNRLIKELCLEALFGCRILAIY